MTTHHGWTTTHHRHGWFVGLIVGIVIVIVSIVILEATIDPNGGTHSEYDQGSENPSNQARIAAPSIIVARIEIARIGAVIGRLCWGSSGFVVLIIGVALQIAKFIVIDITTKSFPRRPFEPREHCNCQASECPHHYR